MSTYTRVFGADPSFQGILNEYARRAQAEYQRANSNFVLATQTVHPIGTTVLNRRGPINTVNQEFGEPLPSVSFRRWTWDGQSLVEASDLRTRIWNEQVTFLRWHGAQAAVLYIGRNLFRELNIPVGEKYNNLEVVVLIDKDALFFGSSRGATSPTGLRALAYPNPGYSVIAGRNQYQAHSVIGTRRVYRAERKDYLAIAPTPNE